MDYEKDMIVGGYDIVRSVTMARCVGQYVNESGEFDEFSVIIPRAGLTPEKATKVLRRDLGDNTITIVKIEEDHAIYRMSLTDFARLANVQ